MSTRLVIQRDGVLAVVAVVLSAVALLVAAWLGGAGAEVTVVVPPAEATATEIPTPSPTSSPEAALVPEVAGGGRVEALAVSETFPPVESVIGHYFGPLGEDSRALAVASCETGGTMRGDLVGAAGELGPFQLHPQGAGKRFIDAGWNLMDPRENVIAAALVVAGSGWGDWSACLR